MSHTKRIALVAHDNCKKDIQEWTEWNWEVILNHKLVCTGTTGKLIEETLLKKLGDGGTLKRPILKLKSGPLGGDQQLGSLIAQGKVDMVIFFWDPMQPHPHDVDVKALLRIAVLYNIPIACNRSTADFIISSPLMKEQYTPKIRDYTVYTDRSLPVLNSPPSG
jgi:methylglyoxal synthase